MRGHSRLQVDSGSRGHVCGRRARSPQPQASVLARSRLRPPPRLDADSMESGPIRRLTSSQCSVGAAPLPSPLRQQIHRHVPHDFWGRLSLVTHSPSRPGRRRRATTQAYSGEMSTRQSGCRGGPRKTDASARRTLMAHALENYRPVWCRLTCLRTRRGSQGHGTPACNTCLTKHLDGMLIPRLVSDHMLAGRS